MKYKHTLLPKMAIATDTKVVHSVTDDNFNIKALEIGRTTYEEQKAEAIFTSGQYIQFRLHGQLEKSDCDVSLFVDEHAERIVRVFEQIEGFATLRYPEMIDGLLQRENKWFPNKKSQIKSLIDRNFEPPRPILTFAKGITVNIVSADPKHAKKTRLHFSYMSSLQRISGDFDDLDITIVMFISSLKVERSSIKKPFVCEVIAQVVKMECRVSKVSIVIELIESPPDYAELTSDD